LQVAAITFAKPRQKSDVNWQKSSAGIGACLPNQYRPEPARGVTRDDRNARRAFPSKRTKKMHRRSFVRAI